MKDEKKAPTAATGGADGAGEAPEAAPKKKRSRKATIAIVVVAALVVVGVGFWTWHNQPSFCNAICHDPMDPYYPTYTAEAGQTAQDKWGNEVADGSYLLASTHRTKAGATCMSCHVPTLSEQVDEAGCWVTDDFYNPLGERTLSDLTEARGVSSDSFCLNESCHNMTRDELEQLTADKYAFNPHTPQHGAQDCTACHKSHRQSVMLCAECHTEAVVPEGWVSAEEGKELAAAQGLTQKGLAGV